MDLKYFIGYKIYKKIVVLCILLPKMNGYKKRFDKTNYMSFLIKDNELLEKSAIILKKDLIVNQCTMRNI